MRLLARFSHFTRFARYIRFAICAPMSVTLVSLLGCRTYALARGIVGEAAVQAFARFAESLHDGIAGGAALADRTRLRLIGRGCRRLRGCRRGRPRRRRRHGLIALRRRRHRTAARLLRRFQFALVAQRLGSGFACGTGPFGLLLRRRSGRCRGLVDRLPEIAARWRGGCRGSRHGDRRRGRRRRHDRGCRSRIRG
jgi:hypothetical protein